MTPKINGRRHRRIPVKFLNFVNSLFYFHKIKVLKIMEKEYLNSAYIRVKKRLKKLVMSQWDPTMDLKN